MQDLELDSYQVELEQDLALEELGLDFSPVEELDQEALDQELVEVEVICVFLFNLTITDYDFSLQL